MLTMRQTVRHQRHPHGGVGVGVGPMMGTDTEVG